MPEKDTKPIFTDLCSAMDALSKKSLPSGADSVGWNTTSLNADLEDKMKRQEMEKGNGSEHSVSATVAFLWLMAGITGVFWTCFRYQDHFGRVCVALAHCNEPAITDARFDDEGRPIECEFPIKQP